MKFLPSGCPMRAKVDEYNAMTIAPVNEQVFYPIPYTIPYPTHCQNPFQGFPSARMVLLKEVKADQGFIFFTNYGSRKVR